MFKRVVMRSGVGSTPPSPPPVIDSRCAMNNLLMLCAIQVRGQIDFMRVGVGVGGAYAYSALMCSMPRVCAACALCYTSPTRLPPPPRFVYGNVISFPARAIGEFDF